MNSATGSILAESASARVTSRAPCIRLSLRARGDLALLNDALGVTLPTRIGHRARSGEVEALCLGPDEWMLHTGEMSAHSIMAACSEVYQTLPHSLVEVSGREATFEIDGSGAADLLALGCARNIDTIGVGQGRRINFDGVTVVLWRDGATQFRMDVWHSFAQYVLDLLARGCRELAAENALKSQENGHV